MLTGPALAAPALGAPRAEIDAAARVLAGLPPWAPSRFTAALGEADHWARHRRWMDRRWDRFDQATVEPLRRWAVTELGGDTPRVVFYPFGGPDILNARLLFPQATTYLLFGLERIGRLPDATAPPRAVVHALVAVRRAARAQLGLNFFRTREMHAELAASAYAGVAGLMLLQLVRNGDEIVDAQTGFVAIDGTFAAADPAPPDRPAALRVRFRAANDSTLRTALFVRGDISDRAWSSTLGLPHLVLRAGPVATLVKAASYLLYEPEFDDVRSTILARSTLVVTEGSGVPVHFFEPDRWSRAAFGKVTRPIKGFARRYCLDDLAAVARGGSSAPLAFSFGYRHRPGTSHVFVARRKPGWPLMEPTFDRAARRGIQTRCRAGVTRVVVQR